MRTKRKADVLDGVSALRESLQRFGLNEPHKNN